MIRGARLSSSRQPDVPRTVFSTSVRSVASKTVGPLGLARSRRSCSGFPQEVLEFIQPHNHVVEVEVLVEQQFKAGCAVWNEQSPSGQVGAHHLHRGARSYLPRTPR